MILSPPPKDPPKLNTCGNSLSTCFFHSRIRLGCTPNSLASSLIVFCSRRASNATRALKSALKLRRCRAIACSFFAMLLQLAPLMLLTQFPGSIIQTLLHSGQIKRLRSGQLAESSHHDDLNPFSPIAVSGLQGLLRPARLVP